jgi:PAS domain S-box-containing protein
MDQATDRANGFTGLTYLRAVVDHAVEGTVLIDERRRVLLVNQTAAEMVGLSIASVIGITLEEWIARSSTFFEDPQPFLALVGSLPRRGPVEVQHDFEIQKPRRKILRWKCRPIDLPGGLGHLFSYLDVTAEVDRLAQVRNSFDRSLATENLTSLGTMVAGMSHHINNPMAFVTSNVQEMLRGLGDLSRSPELVAEYQKEILPETLDGIRRVNAIVNDLRRFAQEDTEPEASFAVNAQVETAVGALETKFPNCEVELRLGELPALSGKPGQLVRVLLHLLTNAAQATTAGTPKVTVCTACRDGTISIQVRDNGAGMSPEVRAKLFQPFFTTRPQGHGVGLGLAVSHGLVKSLGGEIDVETEPGKGSCFTVRLPARTN